MCRMYGCCLVAPNRTELNRRCIDCTFGRREEKRREEPNPTNQSLFVIMYSSNARTHAERINDRSPSHPTVTFCASLLFVAFRTNLTSRERNNSATLQWRWPSPSSASPVTWRQASPRSSGLVWPASARRRRSRVPGSSTSASGTVSWPRS